jgi:hypothetical protein
LAAGYLTALASHKQPRADACATIGPSAEKVPVGISGGVSFLSFNHGSQLPSTATIPFGWTSGVTVSLNDWLAMVGNVGGDYQTRQIPQMDLTVRSRFFSAHAGPRVIVHVSPVVSVFGQALFGVTHRGVDGFSSVPGASADIGSWLNHFSWEPGGGIDVRVARRIGVRFEVSDRLTPMQNLLPPRAALSEPRFVSSLVFHAKQFQP